LGQDFKTGPLEQTAKTPHACLVMSGETTLITMLTILK